MLKACILNCLRNRFTIYIQTHLFVVICSFYLFLIYKINIHIDINRQYFTTIVQVHVCMYECIYACM